MAGKLNIKIDFKKEAPADDDLGEIKTTLEKKLKIKSKVAKSKGKSLNIVAMAKDPDDVDDDAVAEAIKKMSQKKEFKSAKVDT